MMPILLATTAETFALFGAAFALILLLVFQVRLAKKHEQTEEALERLQKAQKQDAVDERARTDEITRAVDRLAEEVQPKLEGIEPGLAKLGSRLDEVEQQFETFHPRTEEAERRVQHLEASTDAAHLRAESAEKLVQTHASRVEAVDTSLGQVQGQLVSLGEELGQLRKGAGDQVETAQAELGRLRAEIREVADKLESVGAAAPKAPPAPRAPKVEPVTQPLRAVAAETRPPTGRAVEAKGEETGSSSSSRTTVTSPDPENVSDAVGSSEPQAAKPKPAKPVETVEARPVVAEFTFEEAADDEHAPGTKGLLILVVVLALLTLGFSLFGGGR